jgi:hypothetical protein
MRTKGLVGPGVVPRPCNFNHLQCQTSLTALTGAKGIFLCCQTGIVTMPDWGVLIKYAGRSARYASNTTQGKRPN